MYKNAKIYKKILIFLFLFHIVNGEAFPVKDREQVIPDKNVNEVWPNCTKMFPDKGCKAEESGTPTVCRLKNCNIRGHDCYEIPLSKEFRQGMVDIHNEYRNMIAEGKNTSYTSRKIDSATNMKALSYDLMLEYLSICVINNCRMGHDPCPSMGKYEHLGQNLDSHGSNQQDENLKTVSEYRRLATNWIEHERELIPDYSSFIDKFRNLKKEIKPGQSYGHFSQFLWAPLSRVGCAAIYEKWHGNNQEPINELFQGVQICCIYWTDTSKGYARSNVLGAPIYMRGPPASKCDTYGDKPNKQYTSLCGEIDTKDLIDGPNPWREKELKIIREGRNSGNRYKFKGIICLITIACLLKNLNH